MPETQDLRELLRVFSPGRMQPYVAASGGDLRAAFRLYAWNVAVSAAFSGPLHCLEVVLRNAMHLALATQFGREDWWCHRGIRLHSVAADSIADAGAKIRRRNKEVTADRIVAELNLGFWTALLGKGVNYETQLWRPALRKAFPHYSGPRARLHEEVETVRLLRNRISHLEPIHRRHHLADYRKVLRVTGYVSAVAVTFVKDHDRVEDVLARRSEMCAGSADPSF